MGFHSPNATRHIPAATGEPSPSSPGLGQFSKNHFNEMIETDNFTDQMSGERMKSKLGGGAPASNVISINDQKASHGSVLEMELMRQNSKENEIVPKIKRTTSN